MVQLLNVISLVIIIVGTQNQALQNCMAILCKILKGQPIWQNRLWDIQDQKGCVFLPCMYLNGVKR